MDSRSTYVVQPGDTLSRLAQANHTTETELQQLNPIIRDRNTIQAGWTLNLPKKPAPASTSSVKAAPSNGSSPAQAQGSSAQPSTIAELPSPQHSSDTTSSEVKGAANCQDELIDIVHVTGGGDDFYVLNEIEAQILKKEVRRVQELMDELHTIVANATTKTCTKHTGGAAGCSCTACKKEEWAQKAEKAQLLLRTSKPKPEKKVISENDAQGKLQTLQQARNFYSTYDGVGAFKEGHFANLLESNWQQLRIKKLAQIDSEIALYRTQLSVLTEADDTETFGNSATPDKDKKHSSSRSYDSERGRAVNYGVREILIFSQPDRRYYVSLAFLETIKWKRTVQSSVLRSAKGFSPELAKQLVKDIRKKITDGSNEGPLGKLEYKLWEAKVKDDCLLNALHKELKWGSGESDAAPYAVGAEAHFLRFAASASAGVKSFNPKAGEIDIGVKGEAAFSLAEGKVALKAFYPNQGGYAARIAYKNADGKMVYHPFGSFRLNGSIELSCFAGVKGGAEASLQTAKKQEESAGAFALIGTPSPEVVNRRTGRLGLKVEGFAGAQAGGTVSGSLEWLEPEKFGKGSYDPGQMSKSSGWSALAQIKMEGNVAFGVGADYELGLSVANNKLVFTCKGSLVFGPGAGGGFGTTLDLQKIGDFIKVICDTLADVDYRYLLGVSEEAFNSIAYSLFNVVLNPGKNISAIYEEGVSGISKWWLKRSNLIDEAHRLTKSLLEHKAVLINQKKMPLTMLPPETIGPMLWLLSESFVGVTHDINQEKAIVLLFSHIRQWRHYIETLEHMSRDGSKVSAIDSLNKINSFLTSKQQNDFNKFMNQLALNNNHLNADAMLAWNPNDSINDSLVTKRSVLLAARASSNFSGIA